MWPRIVAFLVVVAVLAGVLWYSKHRPVEERISGFVEAHDIRVGSRIGGRIARVLVAEGQQVRSGDLLLELEPFDLKERLAEAQATLARREAEAARLEAGFRMEEIAQGEARRSQLQAQLEKLRAGPRQQEINEAQALLDQSQTNQGLAQQNYDRVARAFAGGGAASRDEMDRATNDLQRAQAEAIVRRERLATLKEGTRKEDITAAEAQLAEAEQALALMKNGSRAEDKAAARAAADAQKAIIKALEQQLAELKITAPADGIIQAIDIRPGDLLGPNAPALTILETSELWVRAYIPENRLNIQTGQKLRVTVDSMPVETFMGEVTYISREAEFTPTNVQTVEERSKQVFRIRVRLENSQGKIRAGMAADVWLK